MEKRRFMKDNKGYTLIEMIIVIAIIAIMTGGYGNNHDFA